jgi:hypothetical protein
VAIICAWIGHDAPQDLRGIDNELLGTLALAAAVTDPACLLSFDFFDEQVIVG